MSEQQQTPQQGQSPAPPQLAENRDVLGELSGLNRDEPIVGTAGPFSTPQELGNDADLMLQTFLGQAPQGQGSQEQGAPAAAPSGAGQQGGVPPAPAAGQGGAGAGPASPTPQQGTGVQPPISTGQPGGVAPQLTLPPGSPAAQAPVPGAQQPQAGQVPDPRDAALQLLQQQVAMLSQQLAGRTAGGQQGSTQAAQPGQASAAQQPDEPFDYKAQIPPAITAQLFGDDPQQAHGALQYLINQVMNMVHNTVLKEADTRFNSRLSTFEGELQQRQQAQAIQQDYFSAFPQHRHPQVSQIVTEEAGRLLALSPGMGWTPELRNAVGARVNQRVQELQMLAQQYPGAFPVLQGFGQQQLGAPAPGPLPPVALQPQPGQAPTQPQQPAPFLPTAATPAPVRNGGASEPDLISSTFVG